MLTEFNLVGDEQADKINHGGRDKAVMAYAHAHYALWLADLQREFLPTAAFGENFTVGNCDEGRVCIGDIYKVGDAIVQVSQPRQPCWKQERLLNVSGLIAKMIQTGRTGITGVATGQGPRVLARQLRRATQIAPARALTISRTEQLRSYRQATLENYRANSDLVEGWIWFATLSARSCAMCIAMAGTWHPLDEDFGSHPNCRCTPVPSMRGAAAGTRLQNGTEWLAAQTDEVQMKVLGKAGAAAWREGRFTLTDTVGEQNSAKWGRSYVRRSLAETLEAAQSPRPLGVPPGGETWAQRYTRPYVSNTGAAVFAPAGWHEAPSSDELTIAKHLADNGIDVTFREISTAKNARNPDAFLNRHKGWETWEFKRQTDKATNPIRSISQTIRAGKSQAHNVLVLIDNRRTRSDDIIGGVISAIAADTAHEINNIGIITVTGELAIKSRSGWNDKDDL
jgi:SPP1 gp7 family putative phage head morphogenesis protein